MKNRLHQSSLKFTLAACMAGSVAWSPASHACPAEPLISSVCIMAAVSLNGDFGGGMYDVADGRLLPISQNAALFSLLSTTYGGNGITTFGIPDLRGRVVVGAGQKPGGAFYTPGESSGNSSVTLTEGQMPMHMHLVSLPVNIASLTAATTLSGLSATANLGGVAINGPASGLVLKASSGGTLGNDPTGKTLGTTSGTSRIYSDAAPSVDMNAGSIGGNLSLSIASGTTAPVTIGGNASTTIGGSASVSGPTGQAGSSLPVSTMMPYQVLTYYIAVQGLYPSRN